MTLDKRWPALPRVSDKNIEPPWSTKLLPRPEGITRKEKNDDQRFLHQAKKTDQGNEFHCILDQMLHH